MQKMSSPIFTPWGTTKAEHFFRTHDFEARPINATVDFKLSFVKS